MRSGVRARKFVARLLALLLLATGATVAGAGPAVAAEAVTVRPDPTYRHQPFQGFGTSLVWFAAVTGGYPDAIRTRLADMLFSPQGLNLTVARYNIGGGNAPDVPPYLRPGGAVPGWWRAPAGTTRNDRDWWTPGDPAEFNPAADPNQRWWVERIKNQVQRWEAFSNSPPWFQTVSGYVSGGFNATTDQLRTDRINDFAAYLVAAVDAMESAHGIRFESLDPFNEPNTNYWSTQLGSNGNPTGGRQEGAHMSPALQAQVIPAVAAALQAGSTNAFVSAPDETNPDLFAADWAGYPQSVRNQVSRLNVHTYGTGNRPIARDLAKASNKPLWMSEVDNGYGAVGQSFTSMDPGLGIAAHVTDDLRELEPSSWIAWQAIEDFNNMRPGVESPGGANWGAIQVPFDCDAADTLTTCPIRTNTKFHTLRNFTQFILPGDRVIATNSTSSTAALRGEDLATVVHVNSSNTTRAVTLDLSGFATVGSGATVRPIVTDVNGALVTGSAVAVTNKRATVTVPARSVTTFVVTGVSSAASGTGLGSGRPFTFTGEQSGLSLAPSGTAVVQRTTNSSATDQRWTLTNRTGSFGARDQFVVTNAATGQRLAAVNGSAAMVASGTDTANARWVLSTTGDGRWSLINVATGQLLDVIEESRADGARIGLFRPTNGANQRWTAVAR